MNQIGTIKQYCVYRLDKEIATTYATPLAHLADSIPQVTYTEKEVLAESKPGRIYHGKWEHSLVVFDKENPIALIIGYEREKEDNNQYPDNSIYISELAVHNNYQRQGLARELIKHFLDYNKSLIYLNGELIFTIQTNSANWNKHVIDLYKSFGFKQVVFKEYDNRTDIVLKFIPNIYAKKTVTACR